ncbi:MAG: hypothetical protein HY688_00450 [Chloroflexi bacterium]|nr:hypothetical protein [Chloroflexota bacterium]
MTAVLGRAYGTRPRPPMEVDGEGYVVRYAVPRGDEEPPFEGRAELGVYLVEPGVPRRLAKDTSLDWAQDVMLPLVQKRQVRGWPGEGFALQVLTPEDLRLAEALLAADG